MAFSSLHELLYGCPGVVGLGECRSAAFDLEDRLRGADLEGHFVIRSQDELEEATHFEWVGRVGSEAVHLESMRSREDSHVTLLALVPAGDIDVLMSGFRGKPVLLRI
jgi:hypothetical protein